MKQDTDGILIVDKKKGMTSHDVVDLIRRRFGFKKVGHAGTLDPNATGVLVLLLGRATKLSEDLTSEDKGYEALMKLGESTDSGDSAGSIISTGDVTCTEIRIKEVMREFVGEIFQVPPMVSAKKVGGKRLYKLARKGIQVERRPRPVIIKEITVNEMDLPEVAFTVFCSKGTYIRQLAHDIGEKLGCGAHLKELRRIRSGAFSIEKAVDLDKIADMTREEINESILRI